MKDIDPEKALNYMASTDEAIGTLKGRVAWTEDYKKIVLSQEMAKLDGAMNAREMEARGTDAYIQACKDHADAVTEYNTIYAKRGTAEYAIEIWRSQESSRRHGNI